MRKFCRRTSVLTLAVLLVVPVSGCLSGIGSQTMATPDTTAQIEISNEESKIEESKDTGEPATTRLVHYMGEQAKGDALDATLTAFSKAHPEIKVDVEVAAPSSYIATYKDYIAAGEAPDIMFGKPQTMQEFVDDGYLMDLKDKACTANILPMLADECAVNGGVHGFPIDAQAKAMFYNKKILQEAGVEVPATRGELLKVCDTFMDQGVYFFVCFYSFIYGVFHELDPFFTSMVAAIDNENVWMDSQNGVKDLSSNPAVVETMEVFSKFASYKDAGDTAVDQIQGIQNFAAGQRPMYMNGRWLTGDVIAASPNGELGMFPTPWSDNPEENKLRIGIDGVFVVFQQTEHKDEVMTLLSLFANEESSKTWMSTAKSMASNTMVPTDDVDAFIKEIKPYIDNDMIVSKSLVPDYTSEYSTAPRTKLQEFATLDDSQRDVTKLLKDIDDGTALIRQQFLKYI